MRASLATTAIPDESIEGLLFEQGVRWDRMIAADLANELEELLGERVRDLPEMRRFLAIKGYRRLREYIEADIGDKSGEEAIRVMAFAMRAFALAHPGLSAATFRNATTDTPEWQRESDALVKLVLGVLGSAGIVGDAAITAVRILRGLVRGLVLHEMSSTFLEAQTYDETYARAVDVYIGGLAALRGDRK